MLRFPTPSSACHRALWVTALFCLGVSACAQQASRDTVSDDAAATSTAAWTFGAMATSANPYATAAAREMLMAGGHAVDAAIAAHLVLGLVEPQSSGIGGGGFMLVFERASNQLTFHDGREQAPAGATADMFMQDGQTMDFISAWQSGKAIGVPGAVALYQQAHAKHGRLPWAQLFDPAIRLAANGFEVSPRLAYLLERVAPVALLDENPGSAEYFYPGGSALTPGTLRKNPEYAHTLTRIANEGINAFYRGEIAAAMAQTAQAEPFPGTLTVADIQAYRPVERRAICGPFRDMSICSATPPSSGAAQVMMATLYDYLSAVYPQDPIRAFVDAQRLAYADRDHYFADPDHTTIPLQQLLNPDYLRFRAQQPPAPAATPEHGDPSQVLKQASQLTWGADTTEEPAGTTHLSVIDQQGNAVSFTATVEAPFGSSRWVHGFLLNNEMTDFAREVDPDGPPPANVIGPGKRPRSSMSPSMVFDADGQLIMVTGSPGGNSIPAYVAKTIIGVFDWGLSAQQAADHPNIIAHGQQVRVEIGVEQGPEIAQHLRSLGYDVKEREGENSGIHLIVLRNGQLEGAADMRREGTVEHLP